MENMRPVLSKQSILVQRMKRKNRAATIVIGTLRLKRWKMNISQKRWSSLEETI